MIKAVIFDWGGVLVRNPSPKMLSYISKRLGISKDLFLKVYKKYEPNFQKGITSEKQMWEKVCKELKIEKPKDSFLMKSFIPAYHPKKNMFLLASKLQKKGYKTALLSNAEIPTMNHFFKQKYGMFDVIVFSCAVKSVKPEKKIYQIALKRLNVKPNESVFTDDKPPFVKAAKKLGINAVVFKNIKQFKKELRRLGIT